VPWPLLQAIADTPEEALYRRLTQLQAAEFLYETSLFPERAYTFKHALTHEVAYGSLLQEQRRVLHARIVKALEVWAGDRLDDQVERLAHHALRGGVWDQALAYSQQEGEKALARSAYREAVGSFEQALGALQHLPEQRHTREQAIDLRLALRTALYPSGDAGRILAVLREAEALAEALDDHRRLGQVLLFLSQHFYHEGAYDQAIAASQRVLVFATASRDAVLHARANYYCGLAYEVQTAYRQAIDCLGEIVVALKGAQRYERFGQATLPAVVARANAAGCHAELGLFAEGRALGEEGLRMAEAAAHPASLMIALWGLGLLALRQGDLQRALPLLERAMGLCQDADLPSWFPRMAAPLGAAYTLAGRVADALPLLTQALAQTTATDRVDFQARCRLPLGEGQLVAGHLTEAQTLAKQALTHAREHQEQGHQAYALHLLGEIAMHRAPPDVDEAAAHYRQALALAEELGMRPLAAHCYRGLGTLYAMTGQREQARTALSTAIEMYTSMAMTFWLPQAQAALAQVEGR
jgi:tetratricopeptide (TPR) repeat protein